MVAIFTGLGAGFERGSGSVLGGAGLLGSASLGRNKEQVLLNAATGNLLISQQDEFLVGLGPDSAIGRTYNSIESVPDGDNGDHWRQSTTRAVHGLTGTLNTTGSTIKRTSGDGSDITYTYQTINGVSAYFATDGSGAYDKLVNASGVWTWTDGDTQSTETYAAYGTDNWRITEAANTIGLKLTFTYTGATLTQVTTQDGSYEQYNWSGGNITQVTTGYTDLVTSTAKTLTRTRYTYDSSNRLTAVTADLSPGDNSIADGKVYTTSYTYIGATKMVATITETDGTSLTIDYDGSNRVHTLTQAVAGTTTRVTTIDYYSGYSTVTDASGQVTRLDYDASDNLTKITAPAASTGLTSQVTKFTYDANGNVTSVTDPLGNVTAYSNFTAWGDAQTITDPLGNVTARTYGSKNELLTETVTGDDQSGTAQSHTTRYVYDASNRLAFEVSPDGNVVEHRYAQTGEWAALTYVGQVYDTSGLSSSTISTNLKPDLTNASQWTKGNVAAAGAGTIGGEPATQFTTQTTGSGASIGSGPFTVAAGDTLTWEVAIKGAGTTLQDLLGFYGSASGWGDTVNTTATVLSGPGSFTGQYYSLWVIGNLSTTTETRVRITRTFTQAETVYGYFYVKTSNGATTAGDSVILASPNIVKTTTGQAPTLAQMNAWVAGLSDPTAVNQINTQYDARGNVTGVYGYAASTNPGTVSAANGYSFASYVYDQAGQLLSRKDYQHNAETYVYDGLGRVVASVDLQGSTTSVLFDDTNGRTIVTLANGLTQTSTYNKAGDLISSTQSTASISTNLKPDLTNASQWTKGNVAMAAAGTIGGEPATQFTTQTTGSGASIGSGPFTVAAGDTLTWEVAIKGAGTTLQDLLGFYGSASGWGDTVNTTATVLSGPGSFTGQYYSLWVIGNLSTTTETRVRITRTFTQAETVYGYFYVKTSNGATTAGDSVILASPNIVKTTASTIGINLKPDLTNASQWTKGNVAAAAAGTIGGEPATQFTTQTTGSGASVGSGPFTVAAGDTLTWEVAIKGAGTTLQDLLGFYGSASGWGDTVNTTATVLSGPGSFTGQYYSLWVIGNLSTTTETRVRITRTFTQAETVYGYFYVKTSNGATTAGDSVILASPNIVKTTAADALVTVATSTYGYDQLGRLRIVTDATQHNSYMIYDNAGRKVGDVDHYGVLTEYKYDADNRVIATVRYATALTSTQLATLQTLPVAFDLATNRPAGSASDLWTFNVYDKDGRTIETVDGAGDATAYSYDASGKLTGTTAYFNKLTATQIANLKAAVSVINLEPDLSNTSQWGLMGLTRSGTGPYTFTATGTAGNLWAGNFIVAAGDTLVWDVTVRGAGSTLTDALGFYSETGWGDSSTVTASILSGPGSIALNTSAPVTLTGLQTNADTRIRITRTFATAATASAFFYVKGCNTATAGDAVTLSAPSIAYLPRYTSASEALNRISNSQFDGTTGWMTGTDPQNIVNSGSPYTGTSGGHSYIKTGFTATGSGQVASISTGASDWFKVVPGERLSASAGFEGIGPISSLTFVFNWRDANGNALPTTTIGQINGTATFNSKLSGFATVPVGAVDARLEVYMTSSAAGTGSFSMIEPMVSTASAAQTDQPPFLPTPIFDPVHDKTSRIFYDKTGRVVGTLDGEGYLSTATYDAGGFKIAETAYASQVASGDRASASLATIQSHLGTNSANRTTHYVYDNEGLLTFVVDALNHVTEYAYPGQSLGDVIGRPTKTIQYAGTISSPSGWTVAGVRAAINAVSGLASNSSNRISQAVYDAHENLSYAIDPAGGFTAFTYDNMGHVTRTVRYATLWDGSTPATFAASHASDANNRTTRSYYDARGDLTFTIDGEGYVTRYDYDAEDRQVGSVRWDNPISLASVTDATLVTDIPALVSGTYTATATSYDMDGRVASTTDGEGAITSYIYNANGTLNTSIDAYGTSDAVQTYYVYDAAGRVVSRYDAYGATEQTTTSFTYDGLGNVLTSTDPNGAVTTYDHDHLGRVITRTDALTTGVVRYQYDAFGETVKVTDARGKVSYNYYNNDGTLAYTIAPLGEVTEYRYDVFGELSDTIRYATRISLTGLTGGAASSIASTVAALANSALDSKSHLAFNANGTVSAKTDALGAVTSFGYDAFGDVTSETDPLNTGTTIQTTRTYDRRGLLKTEVVDSASGGKAITTNYNLYDAFGRVLTLTDPALQVTTKTYDRDGRVLTSTDALNQTTNYYYDKRGNLAAVQAPPPKTGDPRPVTRYAYDKLDRLVYTVDALGDVTQNTYDNDGHVILSRACAAPISLSGLPIVASLSAIATLVGAGTSGDEITHSVYDADGQLRYSIDARNFLTEYAYDAAGNAIRSVAYSTAISSTSTYTIAGIQAQIALMSGPAITLSPITRNVYNADGQRSYTIDALGFVTAYTYDTQGNVTKQVRAFKPYTTAGDPSDATMASWITANPDARDRITRAIYDQKGQLRFDVDAENYVTQYTYNEGGSVRFITRYGDRFDGTGGHIAFADATTLAQAITNVAATQVVPAAITEYRYDTAGRLVETVDPTNVHTVLTLNQLGQATQTVVAPGTTDETITKQSYDALGRVTSTTRAFGQAEVTTTSYRYDALSRVTDTLDGNGNAAISALVGTPTQAQIDAVWTAYATHYTYDANGNVLTTSVALDSGVANAVTTNTYDAFGNLVSVTDPRLNVGYFYYNTLNQLTLQVDPEGYATGTTYTFAGETESVTRYATALVSATYSATVRPTMAPPGSADETTTFGYDLLNRLTSTTDAANYTESYGLDAFGNRLSITNKLGTGAAYTTIYTYDLRGLMLTETLPMQSVAANGTILATVVTNAYKYDSRGNRVKMVEAQGLPEQRTTLYEYDALDRLTKQTGDVVATLNQGTVAPITTYQYDRQGNLLLTTDPNGARTFSYYDHLGRKTLEINAVGMASAWTYDANSNNVQQKIYGTVQTVPTTTDGTKPAITNPTVFRQTDYSFDRNNRLWKTSTPSVTTGSWNGSSYTTTTGTLITGKTYYDASGNIVQTTDGNGVSAYIYYDKAGRKVGQVDGAGYLTAYVLDQDGNVWTETRYATAVTGASASSILTSLISAAGSNANNRITQFTYDKMGRRLTEKRLNVASAAIDVNGAMTTTTADALITYTYNGLGEVASKTEAAVDVTSGVRDVTNYIYDAAGRLITTLGATMTDSAGLPVRLKTSTSYDGLNNVTRTQVGANTVSSWADRITTYTYGAGGRLMATTNAGVNAAETKLTTYSVYDLAGHLVRQDQIRNTSDAASSTVDFRTSYSYDALGRATSQQSSYLSATTPAVNDYSKNLIVNGSFEDLGTVHHTAEWGNITSSLPGWTKTNSGLLNITTGLGYGIGPTDGIYGLDSDGEGGFGSNIDIYQTINGLTAGQVLQLGLDHMDVRYTNSIEVSWNGVVIGTLTGTGTVMKTDWLNVTAIAGGNTLRLRETGSQDAYGMVLDNVRLFAALPSSASSGWVNGDSQGVAYDAYGEIVAQTINGTLTTQAVYDSTGHVVQSNSGDGTWKTYINDGNGNATLTIQTIGTTDLAPLTVAQALALATNNGANTAGAAAGNGVVVTIGVFDARNQQTQVLMPLRDSVMDANNVVTSYTVGQNLIKTTQAYNAFGEVASQTDARGNTTSFVYNSMGRVTAQISPQVQITGENGQASSSVQTRYDASSAWNTTPTQYSYFDASGRLVATRDANGNLNTRILLAGSGYGGADPLTLVEIHPDGGKIKTGYDVFGDAVKITDALNKVTTNIFDQVGNLIEVRHPIRALNSDGSAGDGLQLIDYYSYDGLSERVGHSNNVLTNPIYGAPVAEYHNGGYPNYTGYTTYSSPITGYTPVTETTAYDSQGRVISTTDFGGHTIQYLYQWNGAQATAGLATYGGWTKIATYMDSAKTSKDTTDAFGRQVAKTDLGGNVYSYTFNKAGELITETSVTSAGVAAENIAYTYYNTGKISTISDNSTRSVAYYSASVASAFSYDRAGNRLTTSYISVSNFQNLYWGFRFNTTATTVLENSTATYDAMNRVVTISDPGDSANKRPSFSQTRTYDANGNVRSNITTHQGIDSNQNLTAATTDSYWFAYDTLNEFVVTEGTLSGAVGAAGTHVVGGTTGTVITYYATGQRRTAASYSGYQYSQDTYVYTADGYLSTVGMGTSWDGITFTSPVIRSVDTRDALGRVTAHNEYNASGATYNAGSHSWTGSVVYGRTATYNNLGQVTWDQVSVVQGSDTNVTSTTYSYVQRVFNGSTGLWVDTARTYLSGNVLSQVTSNLKNNDYAHQYTVTTSNSYSWYDNAQQREITAASSGNQTGNTTSIFSYDGNGHVAQVTRSGQYANTISYTTTVSGQIMARKQQQSAGGASPAEYYFYLNNVMVGQISNNGSENLNYAASINQQTTAAGTGPFANGATSGAAYANFDLSYQAMNPTAAAENGSAQAYTVIQGDTLSTVAQNIYGDSALWYLIAEVNGLNANSPLTAGQILLVPNKVANSHNNASTFRPYNPNAALGDVQPGTPVPPKKNCGILGMILLAVIAVAVAYFVGPAAIHFFQGALGGLVAGTGAVAAGSAGAIGGAIIGGAVTGALASAVSQGIGVATGLQDQFSWKAVGLAALGGAVTAGIGPGGIFGGNGLGAALGIGSKVLQVGFNGAVGSAITQGIGVATHLQDKFSWAGVAVAGIGAMAGYEATKLFGATSLVDVKDANGNVTTIGDHSIGNNLANLGVSAAKMLAKAATRSVIEGTDFGDNIISELPDAIGETIVGVIGEAISKKAPGPGKGTEKSGPSPKSVVAPGSAGASTNDGPLSLKQRAEMTHYARATSRLSGSVQFSGGEDFSPTASQDAAPGAEKAAGDDNDIVVTATNPKYTPIPWSGINHSSFRFTAPRVDADGNSIPGTQLSVTIYSNASRMNKYGYRVISKGSNSWLQVEDMERDQLLLEAPYSYEDAQYGVWTEVLPEKFQKQSTVVGVKYEKILPGRDMDWRSWQFDPRPEIANVGAKWIALDEKSAGYIDSTIFNGEVADAALQERVRVALEDFDFYAGIISLPMFALAGGPEAEAGVGIFETVGARLFPKAAGRVAAGRVAAETGAASKVVWVDENVGLKGLAKDYNDSAMGARSNPFTKTGQAPALERTMPDGTTRLVKFDGVDGNVMVDRKVAIVTTQKAKDQALRQSEVLAQNGLTGRWEVPTVAQQTRAVKMLNTLNVNNIKVVVEKPW